MIPTVTQMDQLSDWIGSFLPGGSRLPARHPVKVTVVMGLFGLLSGWLTVGLMFAVEYAAFTFIPLVAMDVLDRIPAGRHNHPTFLGAQLLCGLIDGFVVIIPLITWVGRTLGRKLLAVFAWFVVDNLAWWIYRLFDESSRHQAEFLVYGVAEGLSMILLAAFIYRRTHPAWRIAVPIIIPLMNWANFSLVQYIDDHRGFSAWSDWIIPIEFGWFFSVSRACFAICLAAPLWDLRQQPKFEPGAVSPQEPVP